MSDVEDYGEEPEEREETKYNEILNKYKHIHSLLLNLDEGRDEKNKVLIKKREINKDKLYDELNHIERMIIDQITNLEYLYRNAEFNIVELHKKQGDAKNQEDFDGLKLQIDKFKQDIQMFEIEEIILNDTENKLKQIRFPGKKGKMLFESIKEKYRFVMWKIKTKEAQDIDTTYDKDRLHNLVKRYGYFIITNVNTPYAPVYSMLMMNGIDPEKIQARNKYEQQIKANIILKEILSRKRINLSVSELNYYENYVLTDEILIDDFEYDKKSNDYKLDEEVEYYHFLAEDVYDAIHNSDDTVKQKIIECLFGQFNIEDVIRQVKLIQKGKKLKFKHRDTFRIIAEQEFGHMSDTEFNIRFGWIFYQLHNPKWEVKYIRKEKICTIKGYKFDNNLFKEEMEKFEPEFIIHKMKQERKKRKLEDIEPKEQFNKRIRLIRDYTPRHDEVVWQCSSINPNYKGGYKQIYQSRYTLSRGDVRPGGKGMVPIGTERVGDDFYWAIKINDIYKKFKDFDEYLYELSGVYIKNNIHKQRVKSIRDYFKVKFIETSEQKYHDMYNDLDFQSLTI